MNLLIIKNPDKFWLKIAKELTDLKKVIWVGTSDNHKNLKNFTHTESILCKKKIKTKKKIGLNNSDFDLINENYTFLNDILNRYTANYSEIYFENKRRYIIDCYEFWKNIILSYPVDKVISRRVPHRFYDNLIYLICRNYKIPIIFLDNTTEIYPIKDKLKTGYYFSNNLNFRTSLFKKKIAKKNQKLAREYIKLIKEKSKTDLRPNYFKNKINIKPSIYLKIKMICPKIIVFIYLFLKSYLIKKKEFKIFFEKEKYKVREASNFEILLHNYSSQINLRNYINYYSKKSLYAESLKKKKYLYLSLSRDFEKTVCPDGKYFKNVNFIVDYILYYLPKNYYLAIKEHPMCMKINNASFINRSKSFLDNIIKKSKKIILIKANEDQVKLISNAKAVVTLTGTSAWEAAILGKHAAIFGTNWYERFISIDNIKTNNDYIKFIKKIYKSNKKNNFKKIYNFLSFLYGNIFLRDIFEQNTENMNNKIQLIVNEIQKKI